MSDPRLGVTMKEESCPHCNQRVMGNVLGNRWCVGQDCDYYVRNGKLVTADIVKQLGARCPIRDRI